MFNLNKITIKIVFHTREGTLVPLIMYKEEGVAEAATSSKSVSIDRVYAPYGGR